MQGWVGLGWLVWLGWLYLFCTVFPLVTLTVPTGPTQPQLHGEILSDGEDDDYHVSGALVGLGWVGLGCGLVEWSMGMVKYKNRRNSPKEVREILSEGRNDGEDDDNHVLVGLGCGLVGGVVNGYKKQEKSVKEIQLPHGKFCLKGDDGGDGDNHVSGVLVGVGLWVGWWNGQWVYGQVQKQENQCKGDTTTVWLIKNGTNHEVQDGTEV